MRPFRLTATAALTAVTAVLLPATVATAGTTSTAAASIVPHAPVVLPAEIEVMPPYQGQTFCDPKVKPGTQALANLLTKTYSGTSIVSLVRACDGSRSEHYDGRAIDWGVDHRNDAMRAKGKAFLDWLFATDRDGNTDAMVRRLGVMYVIWNKRIWGSYSQHWEPYSCSGPTDCHVDHMHISLDWSGAMKKTSFWTGKVTEPMDPPLQTIKPGQTVTTEVSPRYAPTPAYRVVADGTYEVTIRGSYNYDGQRHHRADAECSTIDGTHWHRTAAMEDDGSIGLLDLWLNDRHAWRTRAKTASGCAPAHHVYVRTLTFDHRAPLALSIDDPAPWGAEGSLKVTVHRIR